jgi:DNA-binding response OmpR family regulator
MRLLAARAPHTDRTRTVLLLCAGDPVTHRVHVLVVEDEASVRDVLEPYLVRDGHRVTTCGDGLEALALVDVDPPDLVVLDLMPPGVDGLEVCRSLRARTDPLRHVPIIMLSALAQEDDRITGLSLGADDYVTKPFSPRELALRVGSVLRRSAPADPAEQFVVRDGALVVDRSARRATLDGIELHLTLREFDLLAYLVEHQGQVYSRLELLREVWGWEFADSSTVTVHVNRLRAKLREDAGTSGQIVTVYGLGYRYDGAARGPA